MSRRGTSSGGGASSLGFLFGSDSTTLTRPHNRAPRRHPQPLDDDSMTMQQQQQHASSTAGGMSRYEHGEDHSGYDTPASGYETPTGYHTPSSGYDTPSRSENANSGPPPPTKLQAHYRSSPMQQHQFHYQTSAAGKIVHDGGGMSLDMSGGSMMGHNNYFRADGQNSGIFNTGRPSIRVQAAPGVEGSSLGYLFGGE